MADTRSSRKRGLADLAFVAFWFVPIPFIYPYRVVKEGYRRFTSTEVDVCEKCIGETIPHHKLRLWEMSNCFVCRSDNASIWKVAAIGGPDRCQRMSLEEFREWVDTKI